MQNPALQGIVITSDMIVPNFSWTPRMAMPVERLAELLDQGTDDWQSSSSSIILVPAVHGRVVRLFFHREMWFVASNLRLEAIPSRANMEATLHLVMLLESCLQRYNVPSAWHFTRDLERPLCWFFALYPGRQTMLFLGTCRVLAHSLVQDHMNHVDLGFALHTTLPPAVPILPAQRGCPWGHNRVRPANLPTSTKGKLLQQRLHNANTLQHTDLYDGILLINTQTMFAIHLACLGVERVEHPPRSPFPSQYGLPGSRVEAPAASENLPRPTDHPGADGQSDPVLRGSCHLVVVPHRLSPPSSVRAWMSAT